MDETLINTFKGINFHVVGAEVDNAAEGLAIEVVMQGYLGDHTLGIPLNFRAADLGYPLHVFRDEFFVHCLAELFAADEAYCRELPVGLPGEVHVKERTEMKRCAVCGSDISEVFVRHADNLCLGCGDLMQSSDEFRKKVATVIEGLRNKGGDAVALLLGCKSCLDDCLVQAYPDEYEPEHIEAAAERMSEAGGTISRVANLVENVRQLTGVEAP